MFFSRTISCHRLSTSHRHVSKKTYCSYIHIAYPTREPMAGRFGQCRSGSPLQQIRWTTSWKSQYPNSRHKKPQCDTNNDLWSPRSSMISSSLTALALWGLSAGQGNMAKWLEYLCWDRNTFAPFKHNRMCLSWTARRQCLVSDPQQAACHEKTLKTHNAECRLCWIYLRGWKKLFK